MSAQLAPGAAVAFPSLAWFAALAQAMNGNRARQEQLGYVDCTVAFTVTDGAGGAPWTALVAFEEFACTDVRVAGPGDAGRADFALEASLDAWRTMIGSIAAGGGRPALEQSLNRLSHMGTPFRLAADDPLKADLYFRYNQSLQEFVNASAAFTTVFPGRA